MSNVILQDLNAIVHGTSQHGLPYDVAHVSILLHTDTPIDPKLVWSVPHIEDIPQKAVTILKDGTTPIYPMLKDKMRKDIEDILIEVDQNKTQEVVDDAVKAILLSTMHATDIKPLESNNGRYIISYKYRLYPISPKTFDFQVVLPFDGLTIDPKTGKLQVTLVAPIGAKINPQTTNAKDFNGNIVAEEAISPTTIGNKQIVSFKIQQDPIFTIRYSYQ